MQRPTGVTGAGEGEVRASGEVGGRYNRERAVRVDQGVCGGVIFGEVWDRLHRARGRPVLFAGRDGRVRDTESVGEISRDQEDGRGVDDGFGGQVVGVRGCEREHDSKSAGDESSGGKRSEKNERHEARFCTTASRIAQFAAKVSYSKTSKMHEETEKRKTDKKQRKNEKNEETTCCYVVGAFDVFNAGHVELLEECSFVADKVVCAVIADEYLTRDQTNQPPPMLNQSERAMSAIACRHCDDVVVGAPARLTDDICKTFNVTAVVFEDDDAVTERDRNVCEKNGVQILSVKERVFSRKKLTIAKRVQANRALFEERQKRKMASEKAYYEQKAFVAED